MDESTTDGYADVARSRQSSDHGLEVDMRTECTVAALVLALGAGACGRTQEKTAGIDPDLQKDLATVTTQGTALAIAPQNYQRMRFVSSVEQVRNATPAKRPTKGRQAARAPHPSPRPMVAMATEAPAPAATPQAAPSEEPIVVAAQPAPEPAPAPVSQASDEGMGRSDHGSGLGGLLAGIIGSVVIRGGHSGVDPCDPKTDGRGRGRMGGRPVFSVPIYR
jgi:hypothetical protein